MAHKNKKKDMDINELTRIYDKSETQFKGLFAEQRSNIQLVAGNHYSKRGHEFWNKLRNNHNLTKSQKVRISKNHIQKITKTYINNILSHSPGVVCMPKNVSEYSDQKDAELNNSVWYDIRKRHNWDKTRANLVKDFIEIGEAWLKIFFDPKKGQFLGLEAEEDDRGKPRIDADGDPVVLRRFTGDVVMERVLGFNVLTDPEARSYEESRYVIYRKMLPTKELKAQFKGDEEKQKMISESADQTWMLFDGVNGKYRPAKGMTMIREYYFRPSFDHPNGYYYITTPDGVLFEGELPGGIFPIVHVGFDEASTSARSFSIIKQLRGPQAEINRVNSKIVEHQITLGDDKIVTQAGTNLTPGGTTHGIKEIKSQGPVTHIPGRTGDQYLDYLQQQITEMYFLANVEEDSVDKPTQLDPYAMLFRSMKDKKRFTIYASKWERFEREVCDKCLRVARDNYDDEMIIQVLDKKEMVNIPEFRDSDDLSFDIVIEPRSEDLESQMGKQMTLDRILQFAGGSLDQNRIGKLIRAMPLLDSETLFDDFTIDHDNVMSDILALDRGEFIPANPRDNHAFYIERLNHRMKRKDFQFLPLEAQQAYEAKIQQHEQIMAQQAEQAARAQAGFIPTGGFSVTADIRVPRADDPTRTERAKFPVEALDWLIKKLSEQGTTQELLQSLPDPAQADIGALMSQQSPDPSQGEAALPSQEAI